MELVYYTRATDIITAYYNYITTCIHYKPIGQLHTHKLGYPWFVKFKTYNYSKLCGSLSFLKQTIIMWHIREELMNCILLCSFNLCAMITHGINCLITNNYNNNSTQCTLAPVSRWGTRAWHDTCHSLPVQRWVVNQNTPTHKQWNNWCTHQRWRRHSYHPYKYDLFEGRENHTHDNYNYCTTIF